MVVVLSLLVFASMLLIVLGLATSLPGPARSIRSRAEASYTDQLAALVLRGWTPRIVFGIVAAAAGILGILTLMATSSFVAAALAIVAVWYAPGPIFAYLRHARLERFEQQLIDGLELLANAVKSGQTLPQALQTIATQSQAPLAEEFSLMVQQYQLGSPLDRVLLDARSRMGSKQLSLVVSALLVSRERGGDLPETLERISAAMREINRLEEKIRAATAEGRKSARTMAVMPFFLGGMLYVMDPSSFGLLFSDPIGNIFLAITIVLIVTGFLWIRRIVNTPI